MNPGVIMKTKLLLIFLISVFFITGGYIGSSEQPQDIRKEKLLNTARKIMESSNYCALISFGMDGYPNARMMDPFPPDKDMAVWMGTNSKSKKVKEIKNNNNILLYYEAPGGDGYVSLKGTGYIIDTEKEKVKYWKKSWEQFYPTDKKNFILIKVIPKKLEIVSYKNGLTGDPVTWKAPSVKFN